jgi:hypothetical protein
MHTLSATALVQTACLYMLRLWFQTLPVSWLRYLRLLLANVRRFELSNSFGIMRALYRGLPLKTATLQPFG